MKKIAGLLVFLCVMSMMPSALAQTTTGTPFPDVSDASVNFDAIKYLKDNGIISGYPDGTYKPTNEINRAEFTKIVIGALYTDLKPADCFPDVKKADWFSPYVCKAKDTKVIEGYPDGTFKPDNKINFSEASKIVANALGGGATGTGETWFEPYVETLGMKSAIPLSVEFFDENITRDEMAEMIYRLKADKEDKASRTYEEINGEGFVKVDSCEQLKERWDELYKQDQYYGELGGGGGFGSVTDVAAPSAEGDKSSGSPVMTGAANDYSTTTTQVAGVDESDIIKNDGKYIYLIRGNGIRIVEAYPATTMKELVNFTLGESTEGFYPNELYVDGNMLVAIGTVSQPYPVPYEESATTDAKISYPYYGYSRTKVYIVDITDRTKPKVSRSVEFDGYTSASRRVGSTLYLVMNQYPNYYPLYATDGTVTEPEVPADALVPQMKDTKYGKDEPVAACEDILILPKHKNFNYLIAAAVPLNDKTKDVSRSVLIGNSGTIYSSADNLYVAATDWYGGLYRVNNNYDTAIYRFSLDEGLISFGAYGRVPGTILNQFSMDENDGYLRVATNVASYDYLDNYSNYTGVYVKNMNMETIGKVENISPNEQMYSARFSGKTGYLVTFKQVDPLVVLDMSNPAKPTVKGELKVPGYSTYLQPYDDTHVIGFGNDVDEKLAEGATDWIPWEAMKGMKISLFDVSDIEHPKELFKDVIGDRGTYSDVLYNHKALLFDKSKNLLAFPVVVYGESTSSMCSNYTYSTCPTDCYKQCVPTSCTTENGVTVCTTDCNGENSCYDSNSYGVPVFDGVYVYNISLSGLTLKGKVSHYNDQDVTDLEKNKYTNYQKTITRVLYIGEYLYTVSNYGIKANNLSDLIERKLLELSGEVWNIYYGKGM